MIWNLQNTPEEGGKKGEVTNLYLPHAAAGGRFVIKLYIQKFTA